MRKLTLLSLLSFNKNKRDLLTYNFTSREKMAVNLILRGATEDMLSSYSYSSAELDLIKTSTIQKINNNFELIVHFNDSPNPLKEIFRDEDVFNLAIEGLNEDIQVVLKLLYHSEDFDNEFEVIAKALNIGVNDVIKLYDSGKNNLKLYLN